MTKKEAIEYYERKLKGRILRFTDTHRKNKVTDYVIGDYIEKDIFVSVKLSNTNYNSSISINELINTLSSKYWSIIRIKKPMTHLHKYVLKQL